MKEMFLRALSEVDLSDNPDFTEVAAASGSRGQHRKTRRLDAALAALRRQTDRSC